MKQNTEYHGVSCSGGNTDTEKLVDGHQCMPGYLCNKLKKAHTVFIQSWLSIPQICMYD